MSTRQSTTPPAVPIVTVGPSPTGAADRWVVMLRRDDGTAEVLDTVTERKSADQLAAYVRGALADAYSAGVADGQRLPNLAPHEIEAPDFGGQTEHGQA
jgi:hypothetical protein